MTRHGPPDVFQLREAPDPVPGEGEVRIRVRAAGVSFADVLARLGLSGETLKPPCVPGHEVAGSIDAVGKAVTGFHEGDRVIGLTLSGGYADAVTVPADHVFHVPEILSDAEAAAVPINYLTAAVALYRMAALTPGETVLIHNAGGGVGIAATQLARLRRAKVIGTASASKHAALQSFGVEHAIDYRSADVAQAVREITRRRGADVILDSVASGQSLLASYGMLGPLGRLVLFALSASSPGERRTVMSAFRMWWAKVRFDPTSLVHSNRGIFGLNLALLWDDRRHVAPLMELLLSELRAARIAPVLARTFPLDKASQAHRFLEDRQNIGKVVLTT